MPAVVVEGSPDGGKHWREIPFRYAPFKPERAPRRTAPHQPRLDYRMFYEGIGSVPDNMMAGTLALHEGYALSRAGFCDRLLQRLHRALERVDAGAVREHRPRRDRALRRLVFGLPQAGYETP